MSWISPALLPCAALAATRRWRCHRRVLDISSMLGDLPPAQQVVVVPDPTADAHSLPGPPSRIIVTTGMRDLLDEQQYAALLAHERAHLSERHHRLVLLAELAASAHPALRWVAEHVDYLVERAADEHAATHVGCRRTVATAIGLAALSTRGPRPAVDGLHITARAGVVPRRVGRLLRPRTATYPWLLRLLPVSLAIRSIIWTGEATYDLFELLHAARSS